MLVRHHVTIILLVMFIHLLYRAAKYSALGDPESTSLEVWHLLDISMLIKANLRERTEHSRHRETWSKTIYLWRSVHSQSYCCGMIVLQDEIPKEKSWKIKAYTLPLTLILFVKTYFRFISDRPIPLHHYRYDRGEMTSSWRCNQTK